MKNSRHYTAAVASIAAGQPRMAVPPCHPYEFAAAAVPAPLLFDDGTGHPIRVSPAPRPSEESLGLSDRGMVGAIVVLERRHRPYIKDSVIERLISLGGQAVSVEVSPALLEYWMPWAKIGDPPPTIMGLPLVLQGGWPGYRWRIATKDA
jgi:hypothetical protein